MSRRIISGRGGGTEITVPGTTVDAYATVRDKVMKGIESIVQTIENTHGSNGITVNAFQEYAGYSAGEQIAITGFPSNVTAGNKALIQIEHANARLTIQIKNQTPSSDASYSLVETINRL